MPTSLTQDLRRLRKLKTEASALKTKHEIAERKFKEFQAAVLERMDAAEVESVRVDGTLFVPTRTAYASVQDREQFVDWALANDESLVENKERAALINQLVRERLDNSEELPPGLGFYVREVISQRAA